MYFRGIGCSNKTFLLCKPIRLLSGKTGYIDQWFDAIVKPGEFYEEHAESNPRRYFYNVDLQGRLFLEETLPKNIATSIKDQRFLDFFFRMVRPIGNREREIMERNNISRDEYPYCSPCGKELNFIRPAATPIVFHSFDPTTKTLSYAGTKTQDFRIADLAVSEVTGRLFHKCDHMEKITAITQKNTPTPLDVGDSSTRHHYALIRSAVVVSFSDQIVPLPDDFIAQQGDNRGADNHSGLGFSLEDHSNLHPIPWLPEQVETGEWAMPFSEDSPEG